MPPALTFVLVFMVRVFFSLVIVVRLHWYGRGKHARSITSRPKAKRTLLQIPACRNQHRSRPSWLVALRRDTGYWRDAGFGAWQRSSHVWTIVVMLPLAI
jgi:hypothetical protein